MVWVNRRRKVYKRWKEIRRFQRMIDLGWQIPLGFAIPSYELSPKPTLEALSAHMLVALHFSR